MPTKKTETRTPRGLSGPLLRYGSVGGAVRTLQEALGINPDGVFGDSTRAAVIAFQKRSRITADGVVGPETWVRL